MKGYLALQKVYLPYSCLLSAFESLRKAGDQKVEGVALFAGTIKDELFYVQETIFPNYISYSGEQGMFYEIYSEELHRLNVLMHLKGLKLIAQIHSHPGEAYHSESDDHFSVVTKIGGFSIVVPHFGFVPVNIRECKVYRLSEQNKWLEESEEQINQLLIVV